METNPNILVVDDEQSIRFTLSQTLGDRDLEVDVASGGEEALRKVEEQKYALVLLDLKMPGTGGLDVLRQLRAERPELRVVVITAHGNAENAVEALQTGAIDFIQKPFTPEEIREIVERAVDPQKQADSYDELIEQAKASLDDKQFDAAFEHARQALALDVNRAEAFNIMGVAMQVRARTGKARHYFDAALALDAGFRPAQRNRDRLGMDKEHLGEYDL